MDLMDGLNTSVECDVCKGHMTSACSPYVLGCGHSFCKACVQKLQKVEGSRVSVRCPTCRITKKYTGSPPISYQVQTIADLVDANVEQWRERLAVTDPQNGPMNFEEKKNCLKCSGRLYSRLDKFCGNCYYELCGELRKTTEALEKAQNNAKELVSQNAHWEKAARRSQNDVKLAQQSMALYKQTYEGFAKAALVFKRELDSFSKIAKIPLPAIEQHLTKEVSSQVQSSSGIPLSALKDSCGAQKRAASCSNTTICSCCGRTMQLSGNEPACSLAKKTCVTSDQ